jgi:endonuclease III-like uncharacterized protein
LLRLLLPVWELNLCAVQDGQQTSNSDLFAIANQKIRNLHAVMETHGKHFVRSQNGNQEMQNIEIVEQNSM